MALAKFFDPENPAAKTDLKPWGLEESLDLVLEREGIPLEMASPMSPRMQVLKNGGILETWILLHVGIPKHVTTL